jgi:hypothetical protein
MWLGASVAIVVASSAACCWPRSVSGCQAFRLENVLVVFARLSPWRAKYNRNRASRTLETEA